MSQLSEVEPEYLTPEEVAAKLRVQTRTVWGWLRRRQIPAVKVGRIYRIPVSALQPAAQNEKAGDQR